MTRTILLGLSAAVAAGLLFVNVYNSVIDAANWNSAIPDSVATAREYFKVANPGTFFRIMSPVNQLLALLVVIACWKSGRVRYIALGALVLTVMADVLTFGYFYPRLAVMFDVPMEGNTESIRLAVQQWSSMNWFRSVMCLVNTVLAFAALVLTSKKSVQ